jgi:hypothetical protein
MQVLSYIVESNKLKSRKANIDIPKLLENLRKKREIVNIKESNKTEQKLIKSVVPIPISN